MNRQAVIDVGTNSVKFHIGERQADGTWTTVIDRAEVTRLGEGIERTGAIAPAAMERTAAAIAGMTAEAARLGVDGVTAVGTMGLRTATNSQAFLDLVKDALRRRDRGHLRRGRRPARLPGRAVGIWAGRGHPGHLRHRRRQLAVHLRPGNARRSPVQRQRGRRALHREISASTRRCRPDVLQQALEGRDRR